MNLEACEHFVVTIVYIVDVNLAIVVRFRGRFRFFASPAISVVVFITNVVDVDFLVIVPRLRRSPPPPPPAPAAPVVAVARGGGRTSG